MERNNMLMRGATGKGVKELQVLLNKNGANLKTDGIFGKDTLGAVKNFQQNNGLTVDGIVGKNTLGMLKPDAVTNAENKVKETHTPTTTPNGYTPTSAPTTSPLPTAPEYDTTSWDDTEKGGAASEAYEAAKGAINNYGPFTFSENEWLAEIKDGIKNYGEFSYDVNSDALYQQYAEQYARMGKMAMQDTMGQAAAMTGGYGNSYAATAGNQAYQSYIQQLNDKVPELYQLALDRHNMGKQDLYDQYGMLLSEYEREYGLYSDEYQQLLDALGIAKDDYYSGADMFYTEQGNKNSVLGQGFNDSMALWEADTNNKWAQAEWEESANRYANDETWRQKEWDAAEEQREIQKAQSGVTVDDETGKVVIAPKDEEKTSGITDAIKTKATTFESNDALADWAYGLSDNGVITEDEADALIAEHMDPSEKYVDNDDGSKSLSYSEMVKSTNGWTVVDDGGVNWLWGVDNNAIVKAPNGERIRLDNLVDKLVSEGMDKSDAKNFVKKLQKNLGV